MTGPDRRTPPPPARGAPPKKVIEAHLRIIESSRTDASGQHLWQGTRSMELLLGLRDPQVDERLRDFVEALDDDSWLGAIGPAAKRAITDRSVQRFVALGETSSALSLAWATLTRREAYELVRPLIRVMEGFGPYMHRSVLVAALCDVVNQFGDEATVELLETIAPGHWFERTALSSLGLAEPLAGPRLADDESPPWLRNVPPALCRDPLTLALSRGILRNEPYHGLPTDRDDWHLPTANVVMVDIDHLKQICDYFGHMGGDRTLRTVADHLHELVGDRVVRFGGDEFLVLWERGSVRELAQAIVESFRELRFAPLADDPNELRGVTVSAGVASGSDVEKILRDAEDALERAKVLGRNRVEVASSALVEP